MNKIKGKIMKIYLLLLTLVCLMAAIIGGCSSQQAETKASDAPEYAKQMAAGKKPDYGKQYADSAKMRSGYGQGQRR
jgi:PBP1b-binding outer membrane lipoprotein LpoB